MGGRGFCLGAGKARSQPVLTFAQGKMLVNRAESPASTHALLGRFCKTVLNFDIAA